MIKKGDTFFISHGEYGDYHVTTIMAALKDFDLGQLTEDYPHPKDDYDFSARKFGKWLKKEGYAEVSSHKELFTGCYGTMKLTVIGD